MFSLPPRLRWPALGLVAVLLVGGMLLAQSRRGIESDAVQVRAAPLVRTLQFSARVATLSRVDVGSTVTGRVAQVLVREGERVKAGQLLVRLESDELDAALAQAVAAEAQALARLAGLRSTGRSAARAQLEQAEANLTAARNEQDRVRQLVAQGFLSASRMDDARRALEVAQAQVHAAQAQAAANDERGTDIAQAQAQWQAAQAATQAARAKRAQAAVAAPADARVLAREVEPGQIVQPGRALLSLALSGPTQIVAAVDERFLDQLRPGQPAAVVADAFAGQRLPARVLSIAPAVDAQRGAVEVKFTLDQPAPAFLREDMTLSVEVETGRRDRALVLPLRAVRADAEGAQVLLGVEGRAQARPVKTGLRTLEAVELLEGVAEGDVVLLAPALQAGDRVRPRLQDWKPPRAPLGRAGGSEDPVSGLSQAMGR